LIGIISEYIGEDWRSNYAQERKTFHRHIDCVQTELRNLMQHYGSLED